MFGGNGKNRIHHLCPQTRPRCLGYIDTIPVRRGPAPLEELWHRARQVCTRRYSLRATPVQKPARYQKGELRPLFVLQNQGASYPSPRLPGAKLRHPTPFPCKSFLNLAILPPQPLEFPSLPALPSRLSPRPWDVLFPDAPNSAPASASSAPTARLTHGQTDGRAQLQVCISLLHTLR